MLEVRDYSKQELADAIYAGNIKPESRLKKLRREISGCPQLLDDLHRLHYHTGDSGFTAQMVERIKYYLCIVTTQSCTHDFSGSTKRTS